MSYGALHNLRVLDLTEYVAGPYCTRLLAGLGADVLKVESPDGGDPSRWLGPFPPSGERPECSALFLFLNQGKRSVTLDVSAERDGERFIAMLRQADVLVESFPRQIAERLHLSYEALSEINPSLIVTSLSGFGSDGPYREYDAPEIVASAMGGLLYLTGDAGREPLMPAGWQASYLTGTSAAVGTLLALHYRDRTGLGQHVDVSSMETLASVLEGAVSACGAGEVPRRRRGSQRLDSYPLLLLPCRDGHVVLAIASEADWEAFSYFVGDPRLRAARFASPAARRHNAAELVVILTSWLSELDRATFFASAQQWRFPCCSVLSPEELPNDPQHVARQFFVAMDHPVAGRLRYPGPPFHMGASPWQLARAPLLGEHNRDAAPWLSPELTSRAAHRGPANEAAPDSEPMPAPPSAPLSGVRVLDLTSMWSGPFCTRLLADAGAEVVKVELATRPDGTRRKAGSTGSVPTVTDPPAPFFEELNRNKYGVTLDLRLDPDRDHFFALVKVSDVLVENFSSRVMPNLGLSYDVLRALRPDIVMLSMPAFGSTGPYRDAVAFGSGLEAMAGLSALTGYRDGPPSLIGVAYGDPVAGLHGAVSVLAALAQRRHTGRGQHIELAQRETLTQFIGEFIVGHEQGVSLPTRQGNAHSRMAPHGCYRCLGDDRWVVLGVAEDSQWQRLCSTIGQPELRDDARFNDPAKRRRNRALLDAIIERWTCLRGREEVVLLLRGAGVPSGPVLDPLDLLTDPQLLFREFFVAYARNGQSSSQYPGPLCRLSASPFRVRSPAPMLGEHNPLFVRS